MANLNGLSQSANIFRRDGGLIPPAEVVLSWPAPNYVNPDTHSDAGPILAFVFLIITILVYAARMWARIVISKNVGIDDWIMTAAIPLLVGSTVMVVLACRTYGFQWHVWDQTPESVITSRQSIIAIEVLYLATTSLIKISILCFYKRITNGSIINTWIYWIWGSIAFVVFYFFAFTFAIVFTCSPIEGYWHYYDLSWRLTHELKCHNEAASIVAVVVVSTLQDFFLCALPIFLIWNLQIPRRQKLALCGIFGLGLLTCVCGVMRAYYATYVYYYTYDITWYAWYGWIWTTLEAQLGIICACAPALKGFFKRYFSLTTVRSGAYGYPSRKPNSSGGKTPGCGRMSPGNSLTPSVMEMGGIKVSTTTNVIDDKDETESQGSMSSTRNLTALPIISFPTAHYRDANRSDGSSNWHGNRTIISADRESQEP